MTVWKMWLIRIMYRLQYSICHCIGSFRDRLSFYEAIQIFCWTVHGIKIAGLYCILYSRRWSTAFLRIFYSVLPSLLKIHFLFIPLSLRKSHFLFTHFLLIISLKNSFFFHVLLTLLKENSLFSFIHLLLLILFKKNSFYCTC